MAKHLCELNLQGQAQLPNQSLQRTLCISILPTSQTRIAAALNGLMRMNYSEYRLDGRPDQLGSDPNSSGPQFFRIYDCRCFPQSLTIDQPLAFVVESIYQGLAVTRSIEPERFGSLDHSRL
jgi:hypothetical protein